MFPAPPPLLCVGEKRSWQPGQALGRLLVSPGASKQEVQQGEVGNKAAVLTANYRLCRDWDV